MIAGHAGLGRFRLMLLLPAAAGLAILLGFPWFVRTAATSTTLPAHADAIVALTGGADRVETALHLLAAGRADRLLISGANRAAGFGSLARRAGIDPTLADRVTVGHDAADTRGNAAETAAWARTRAVHSLIVVTAGYHMPRALAELERALPGVELHPYPILTPMTHALSDPAALRLLAVEYAKFLIARAGLS